MTHQSAATNVKALTAPRSGHAYAAMTQGRDAGTPHHSLWDVPGVGHEGDRMLTSPCGLKALFDLPGCEGWAIDIGV